MLICQQEVLFLPHANRLDSFHNQLLYGLKISINNQHMTIVNYKNGLSNSNNSAESLDFLINNVSWYTHVQSYHFPELYICSSYKFQIIIFGVQLRFQILGEQLRKFLWFFFHLFLMKVVEEIPSPSFLVTGLDVAKYGIIIVGGNQVGAEKAAWKSRDVSLGVKYTCTYTSNNQRSKRFCFNAVLICVAFTWQMVKTCIEGRRGRRLKRTRSNCILCILFILSASPNDCWLHTCGPSCRPQSMHVCFHYLQLEQNL